ncbi:homoserine kinase [Wenzhouxiangella sp. EGI_FJ10409]|uniref:homoserine kinase n=1 Tax=Wenzhouxiangella sp. EGI_FJ10409 TaxID=3243767 RepID=UPI0035D635DE
MSGLQSASAFAPASVGNAASGFDLLGHAVEGPGDTVTATRSERPGVVIEAITGLAPELPLEPERNTAAVAVQALLDAVKPGFGVVLRIHKGIPLCSGLGGSAASATAGVVAANALLDALLPREALYPFALAGETVASGSAHGDNLGSQLLGGLVLATRDNLLKLPVPESLHAVVVHPDCRVATREAREALREPFELETVVAQQSHLAELICGCYENDIERLARGLVDVMIEPRRARLIPGLAQVKAAAFDQGAIGAAISGAGPTVVAWFDGTAQTEQAAAAMRAAFETAGLSSQAWITPVDAPGARLVDGSPEPAA